jgi:hypothetical protein
MAMRTVARVAARVAVRAAALLLAAAPLRAQDGAGVPLAGAQRATRDELTARVAALEAQLARGGRGDGRSRDQLAATRARLAQGDFKVGDRFILNYRLERVGVDTVAVRDSLRVSLGGFPDTRLGGVLRSELDAHLEAHVARYLRTYAVRASLLTRVAIIGGVRNPGYYYVPPDRPLSDLVMVAGGPAQEARLADMEVRRDGKLRLNGKDTRRAVKDGRTLEELDIQSGDEVRVPERRQGVNLGVVMQGAFVLTSVLFAGLQFLQWYYSRQDG